MKKNATARFVGAGCVYRSEKAACDDSWRLNSAAIHEV